MKRFWDKVDKRPGVDSCWLWTASKNRDGYGQFKLDGKVVRAHQVSWKLEKGVWASYLCHTCHIPACVNPNHLYEGDNKSNGRDKAARSLSWSKYSETVVVSLRIEYQNGLSSNELSIKYKIPKKTVCMILNGELCREMGGPIKEKGSRYKGNRYKRIR